MKLTQAEIIQLLRRRSGKNQGDFGAKAFDTSFESGRTKIKNIELGKQAPTETDLINMAGVLNIPVSDMKPGAFQAKAQIPPGALLIDASVISRFHGLATYLDMLNKAVKLADEELIAYISGKIASVFTGAAGKPFSKAASDR